LNTVLSERKKQVAMLMQIVFRLIAGRFVVSVFAVTGDVLKPRSFADMFGATPSVALATLGLTVLKSAGHLLATPEDWAVYARSAIRDRPFFGC
jgi:hypothetical protein